MFAPPPELISITIYSKNASTMLDFYEEFGMSFSEYNDDGQIRKKYKNGNFSFEIIPIDDEAKQTKNLKLKFRIDEIKGYLEYLEKYKCEIITPLWETKESEHIVISDPDKNHVELETRK
ncbi:VOC family protein [Flavobacterium ardleyense]|uniref:VOC family protein n=1 Tax=Flavobacterium ardleyense TaxID=2038737 RepID=A0ABW5Z6C0_9FLAO